MEFIDTHAHIYLKEFNGDRKEVIAGAINSSVSKIFLPNIDRSTLGSVLDLEAEYPGLCFAMIGLHPCSVTADFEQELKTMEKWLEKRSFSGIGETGTDLYWDQSYRSQQIESLKIQLNWAEKYRLPIILHSRDSLDLSIQIIEEAHSGDLSGIFHCFTGSLDQARQIIDLGFFLGIGGVLTFKNSGLGSVIENVPLEKIVLETDSPYLTPHPHRGKRNEPAYISLIAQRLAEIYDTDISTIADITTENAKKVFKTG
ncbi:MAG: TatD family hydrolase [Cyclobacteriaceae bacterium]|jgi:TatD DNase family protein